MNRLGAQGFTVRDLIADKRELDAALKKIRAIGYDSIELGVPAYTTAAELKKMLDENGIMPLDVGGDVYSLLDDPSGPVEDAQTLGVNYVTVSSIPNGLRGGEDGYHKFAEDMERAGELLEKEGLYLVYHNHAFEFVSFGGYNGMDILLNETGRVKFMTDTHWIAAAGVNPPGFIRRLTGRCPMIHFKDYAIDAGTDIRESVPRLYAEVGEGNLNWPDIVRACRETGVATIIVEQDICKVDPFTSLEISYRAMKRLGL